ncbi:hypothetical protein [Mucilaginibacter pedocola]|uniref:Uncharacterized protein n=1 Tax=Mucilaginibacter pedocola TaxID=1792845 RepID=A0A1S9PD21_9SPHI|nr:hypothetical protein [Mucilaginibacter pedocola]OOQ58874.1 hypothetical protein BC343_09530 [Mucilaginibacter pedocola]
MCGNCFTSEIYEFHTYFDFEEFDKILGQKIEQNYLVSIWDSTNQYSYNDLVKSNVPYADNIYKCNACNETWALSTPENARRGYFLPVDEASDLETELAKRDKKTSRGCIAIIIVIVIILIAAIVN